MNYLDGLSFYSQPDYNFLRQLIQLAMKNNEINPDEMYDWDQVPEVDEEEEKILNNNNNEKPNIQTRTQADNIIKSLKGILLDK